VTIIVVGGHARKVGKTSVATGLLSALSIRPWTAVKISSHMHGSPGTGGFQISLETSRSGDSDTSRYLSAGASKSLWVRAREEHYDEAVLQILPMIRSDPFVLIESNRILDSIKPDLCIMVLKYDVGEFKNSARKLIAKADAAVVVNCAVLSPPWEGIAEALARIPVFTADDPQVLPEDLIGFVSSRLFPRPSIPY
jgi:hypothetical protein